MNMNWMNHQSPDADPSRNYADPPDCDNGAPSTLNAHFRRQHQSSVPNYSRGDDASGIYSSYSKSQGDASGMSRGDASGMSASGIYASYRHEPASVSAYLGATLENRELPVPPGNEQRHFNQRARNAEAHRTLPVGRGAHPRDMHNHPKRGVKKDKDSDMDTFQIGGVDHANRVKFADQVLSNPGHPASSWKGRSVSSTASIGSGSYDLGSVASKSSIDSSRSPAGDSFNISAMWHLREKSLNFKKREAVLLVLTVLAIVGLCRSIASTRAASSGREEAKFADEQQRLPKQGVGNEELLPNMDLTKVPPHLRGYYATLMAGQLAPHSTAQLREQLHELKQKNEMIKIQNEIMGAQAKTIETTQQLLDDRVHMNRTEIGGGGEEGGVEQQHQEQGEEAAAAKAAEEAGLGNMELSEAELEAARQKTKDQLAASRRKAAEEEIERIVAEEAARQTTAEEEGLRKTAAAEDEQRAARQRAAQEQAEQKQSEQQPTPGQLQKEIEELLDYLNKK